MSKISDLTQRALDRVEHLDTRKSLVQLYENALRHKSIGEDERELLIEAIAARLRVVSPGTATKLLGPKDSEAREFLERCYNTFANEFDLSANRVKNGVKTGGDMIAGRMFIDVYISYKNAEGWHTTFAWLQKRADEARFLRVKIYQGGVSNVESISEKNFEVGQEDSAIALYRSHLKGFLKNGHQSAMPTQAGSGH